MTEEERFYSMVSKDCWIWQGARQTNGYGKVCRHIDGKVNYIAAHRWSWMLRNGPIPEGLNVCHKCDVKLCVNPGHLFLGTQADNIRDMHRKARAPVGERSNKNKLTEAMVREIRTLYVRPKRNRSNAVELAKKYGVKPGAIAAVIAGRLWKHVA